MLSRMLALFAALFIVLPAPAQPMPGDDLHPLAADMASRVSDPTRPFTMIVTLKASESKLSELERLMRVHIAASRSEAGNLGFTLSRSRGTTPDEADGLVLVEHWASIAALDRHLRTPHMEANLPLIGELADDISFLVSKILPGAADEEEIVRFYLDRWIQLWSPGPEVWDAEAFRSLYKQGDGSIVVFDNVGGGVVHLRSFDDYAAQWSPMMAPMRNWSISLEAPAAIRVSGDLAFATFAFSGGEDVDAPDAVRIRQVGTLVWERDGGVWQIIHEHLTLDAGGEPVSDR